MNLFRKKEKNKSSVSTVETGRATQNYYSLIDRHIPLSKPEFRVFEAIRDSIPIVDAAICKTVRLMGQFKVECENHMYQSMLDGFVNSVPTGNCSVGLGAFVNSYLDSLLMYGNAIGEVVYGKNSREVKALYNASPYDVELKIGENPLDYTIMARDENGMMKPIKSNESVFVSSVNANTQNPMGRSIIAGLPFVSSVLLKIFDCIGTNWERAGNLRYAVTYKPSDSNESVYGSDKAGEIAREWTNAMSDTSTVKDFVAVGDVSIKVIGSDSQIMDSEIPVRQMLEQIVAKTGLPPFMLGLSWSNTERMSSQQADILTSELEYYRSVLTPVIKKICSAFLIGEGAFTNINIKWNDICLQDEVELAKAELYRAQAKKLLTEGDEI